MFVCKICGKKIPTSVRGKHLKKEHKLASFKEYYDLFLKKKGDGVCKICGKPTKWDKERFYYRTYCSQKCAYKGNNKKRIKTNLKKYGTACTLSLPSVQEKIKCLIEIDGEFYHCLVSDCDGVHAISSKDYLRWNLVPPKVKFLVIDSQRLKEGIRELLRILPMKYKDWKKEMIRSIPKNIEDAIPKYDKDRLRNDWNRLCSYRFNKNAFLGKSILLNFCRSRVINLLGEYWKTLRKTLYKSPCSEHNVLEGLDDFRNTSKLREKYRKKYKGCDTILVKHHSPEKMLAICSLGKNYVSKEPIDKESKRIIKFLDLKVKGF